MRISSYFQRFTIVLALAFAGCGGEATPPPSVDGGGSPDLGGGSDARVVCTSDIDCNDGLFCNGREMCAPASAIADVRGCTPGDAPCSASETCDEAANDCRVTCEDLDGDGHEAPGCGGDDCDDADALRYPGNAEVCDSDDEDCNDATLGFVDGDGDGVASGACCNGAACGGDCNDGNADVRPGALDGSPDACNTIDDDCDGSIDEGCPCTTGTETPCYTGAADTRGIGRCADGFQLCVGGMLQATCNDQQLPDTEICDALDNDCDGLTNEDVLRRYYRDGDADGFGLATESVETCSPPMGYVSASNDCADDDNNRNPGAFDGCNGIDDDCDGAIDEGAPPRIFHRDADGDGFGAVTVTMSACDPPAGYILDGTDCDDASAARHPGVYERCDAPVPPAITSIDDDCDLAVNEGCACTDGLTRDCGPTRPALGACVTGTQVCVGGAWSDCAGAVAARAETCDGRDDDCDGAVDDGFLCVQGSTRAGTGSYLMCASVAGLYTCNATCTAETFTAPAPPEMCDGVDNNCNGVADDGFACLRGATGLGCTTGCGMASTRTCSASCTLPACTGTEVCNACDDDGDGTRDEGFACEQFTTAAGCTTACGTAGSRRCRADCTGYDACRAAVETCNGCDDDLDGAADNGVGMACAVGAIRACTTSCGGTGTQTCNSACGWGTCTVTSDACNYCDDDGDGTFADEALTASSDTIEQVLGCEGWVLNGASCAIISGLSHGVTLANGGAGQARAAWFDNPITIGHGTYRVVIDMLARTAPLGALPADGWAVILAEQPGTEVGNGAAELGVPYGRTGYSIEWKFYTGAFGGAEPDQIVVRRLTGGGAGTVLATVAAPAADSLDSGIVSRAQTLVIEFTPPNAVLARGARLVVRTEASGDLVTLTGAAAPTWATLTPIYVGVTAGTGGFFHTSTFRSGLGFDTRIEAFGTCMSDGTLRIAGGASSGRLEMWHGGVWGTVCDDPASAPTGWSAFNATAACRQLGFSGGTVIDPPDGAATQPIWLDDVSCVSGSGYLVGCDHNQTGEQNCSHSEDVGVSCTP